jgi:DNA-binding NarL/FixJ family response regulator
MCRTIVAALEREPVLSVCGVADSVPTALAAIFALHPDLVLTDLTLKSSSGLDLIQALRSRAPALPVVATTMFDVRANERQARAAGAAAFASKQDGPDALVAAVYSALSSGPAPLA